MACRSICLLSQGRAVLAQVKRSAVTLATPGHVASIVTEATRIFRVASGIEVEVESRRRPAGRADVLFEEERQAICTIADRLVAIGESSGELQPLLDLLAHPQLNDPSICAGIRVARLTPPEDLVAQDDEPSPARDGGGSWISWLLAGAAVVGVGYAISRSRKKG